MAMELKLYARAVSFVLFTPARMHVRSENWLKAFVHAHELGFIAIKNCFQVEIYPLPRLAEGPFAQAD